MKIIVLGRTVTTPELRSEIRRRLVAGKELNGWVKDAITCMGTNGVKMVNEIEKEVTTEIIARNKKLENERSARLREANSRPRVWVFA